MNKRIFSYFLWILLPVALGLRIWQLSVTMNQNGFYLPEYESLCNAMGYAAIAAALGMLIWGRFLLKKQMSHRPPRKSFFLGAAALVLAISCIPQAIADHQLAATAQAGFLALLPSAVTAVSFTVISASQIQGKKVSFGATALPVVSEFVRVLLNYAHFNGIAQISENVIHILFLCSFLTFCLSHCRVYSGVDTPKGYAYAYGTGGCAALFGLLSSVPHWFAGQNQLALSVMGFGVTVYVLVFLYVTATEKEEPNCEECTTPCEPVSQSQPEVKNADEELEPLEED